MTVARVKLSLSDYNLYYLNLFSKFYWSIVSTNVKIEYNPHVGIGLVIPYWRIERGWLTYTIGGGTPINFKIKPPSKLYVVRLFSYTGSYMARWIYQQRRTHERDPAMHEKLMRGIRPCMRITRWQVPNFQLYGLRKTYYLCIFLSFTHSSFYIYTFLYIS